MPLTPSTTSTSSPVKRYVTVSRRREEPIHRVLGNDRFDIEIADRFGRIVRPKDWFPFPLHIVDEIIIRVGDGTLRAGFTMQPLSR